jgi:hypothetical protein
VAVNSSGWPEALTRIVLAVFRGDWGGVARVTVLLVAVSVAVLGVTIGLRIVLGVAILQ